MNEHEQIDDGNMWHNLCGQLYITRHRYVCMYNYICGNLWHQYAANLVQASSKRPAQRHCLLRHFPIPLA